ncbi:CD48 antigen-like [Pungitius pungitius]|uniref:CD48 antigen-like n=1 Tax=Pungitius pungitius TaxID=134920 RepID=UPI002E0F6B4F
MEQLTHVFVLLAALSSVGTAQDVYFTDGDERTFEVRPPVTEKITSIVWKINGDLLAEWSVRSPLEIYPGFNTRTSLDTTNGSLVMKQMTKEDVGTYTVEINHNVQSGKYDMKWILRVNKPAVNITTCSPDSEKCDVTCDGGTEEAEPIQYHWRIGSSEWNNLGKDIVITKEKHGGEKDITCRMKNPVSEEESEPIYNPLLQVASSLSPGGIAGIIIFVFIVSIIAGLGLFGMWKYKKWPCKNPDSSTPEPPAEETRLND